MLIKVLIADDIADVRRLEKRILKNDAEIEVVGEAADASEAVRLVGALKPDVIVMDLNMPGDGFVATRSAKARRPQVRVLVTTAEPELYGPDGAGELGADALLPKTKSGQGLIPAIKRLAKIAA